jgi:trehalose synthase
VVVQKSLAEGFGLTVAEAMWKARPVIATRAGGIQDQIIDGVTGVLLDDPLDLPGFGRACNELLRDEARAAVIGTAAREWVIERFLGSRHLVQYLRLLDGLLSQAPASDVDTGPGA